MDTYKGCFMAVRVGRPNFLSKAAHERSWRAFMAGGTSHSALGCTMVEIINRCEREGIMYQLSANPSRGYYIKYCGKTT